MSKKKQVIIQEVLNTDAEWDAFFAKPGLKVVDAYSEWCGPCKALAGFIKTLKTELSDPLLTFATANASKIGFLKKYDGTSEPITLMYGGDVLVSLIRGANSPLIETVTKDKLAAEHDAIENGAARVEFVDVVAAPVEEEAPSEEAAPAEPVVVKTYSFAIIKPDILQEADNIFTEIAEAGFKVTKMNDVEYTEETAKAAFAHLEGKDEYAGLIDDLTSGPCTTMVLCSSTGDAVASWLSLLTPAPAVGDADEPKPEGEEAKPEGEGQEAKSEEETKPEEEASKVAPSIYEKLGISASGLYGSATSDDAEKEITAAFPELAAEIFKEEAPAVEGVAAAADGETAAKEEIPAAADAAPAAEEEAAAAESATEGDAAAPAAAEGEAAEPAAAEGEAAAPAAEAPAAAAATEEAAPAATEEAAPAAEPVTEQAATEETAAPAAEEAAASAADEAAAPAAEEAAAPAVEEQAAAEPTAEPAAEPATEPAAEAVPAAE